MTLTSGVILCVAYILGLLSTAVAWGGYGIVALGIGVAIILRFGVRKSYGNAFLISIRQIKPKLWLAGGLIGFLATVYFQVRIPQPGANDISKFISVDNQEQIVTVYGNLATTPRLTRNQRGQFWLEATGLDIGDAAIVSKEVTGKLYVTIPLLQATGLHEGQAIAVTGSLYKPKPAANPGAFDFQAYLAQEGGFSLLKGREVSLINSSQNFRWGWWAVRRRIIRSQVQWLGVPEGPLVSAMVLGNRVVDVPFSLKDSFIRVGLAHALAASGFQVSLILGVILTLTRRFSSRVQFYCGVTALLIFVGLTGLQPSVLRAVFMGIGVLIALLLKRKVKPLGLLLLAGTALLLYNPIWIWDLGFQFSFLATIGLVVTVPALMKRLDWLPPAIATLVAVPIAAYVWTLPLQLYTFGLVSPYSIVVNVITTILLSVISIGAFISAIAALFLPIAGSALAWLLYYPTHALIAVVEFFAQLPGAMVAVGNISILQLIALYGLITLCFQSWWRQRWSLTVLLAISLVLIPVWQTQASTRVTVLATGAQPVTIIQDQGKVLLVNSGDENAFRFTVLPFLQQQGVNQIDLAIAIQPQLNIEDNWLETLHHLPIKRFYYSKNLENVIESKIQKALLDHDVKYENLSINKTLAVSSTIIKLIDAEAPILQLQIKGQTWLIIGETKPSKKKKLILNKLLPQAQVLLWLGENLNMDLVEAVQPKVAIASSTVDANTIAQVRKRKIQLFLTKRDGAIQWTGGKFEATLEPTINSTSLL